MDAISLPLEASASVRGDVDGNAEVFCQECRSIRNRAWVAYIGRVDSAQRYHVAGGAFSCAVNGDDCGGMR